MATRITIRITDAEGKSKTVPYYFPDSVNTVALAQGKVDSIVPAVDDLIRGIVTGAEVSFGLALPAGLRATAIDGSRVDSGATLSFTNSAGRAWSNYLPTFNTDGLVNEKVVAAYVATYATIITTTAGNSDPNALDLVAYRDGNQATNK